MVRGATKPEKVELEPRTLLLAYGVPRQLVFSEQPAKEDFINLLQGYDYERNDKPVFIDQKAQKLNLQNILDPDSFDTAILSGVKTDAMAKFLALRIASYYIKHNRLIKWQTIYPSYKVSTPEQDEYPQLLILSNIFIDSSPNLWDQVRSLIDLYHCPKIVVSAGANPHDVMNKSHKAAQIGIYLK